MYRTLHSTITLIVTSGLLAACSTTSPYKDPVPEDYSGPTAIIEDTFKIQGRGSAKFFVVTAVDGEPVNNALIESSRSSMGQGPTMYEKGSSRYVKAQPLTLQLRGLVHHAAPIGYIMNSGQNYEMQGEIQFAPVADRRYLVRGTLNEDQLGLWLEDINGNVVSDVLEQQGDKTVVIDAPKSRELKEISRSQFFNNLSGGESIGMVEEKLGAPNHKGKVKGGFNSQRYVIYTYSDLGQIIYTVYQNAPQHVINILPIVNTADQNLALLLKNEGQSIQHVAKELYRKSSLSQPELDMVAQKGWDLRNSGDRFELDASAWFFKILGKSGNPRYRQVLVDAFHSGGSKVKRHAKSALNKLPEEGVPQFIAQ